MKSFGLLILHCCFAFHFFAQSRYLDEIFTEVAVTSDVVYGKNATILSPPVLGEPVPIDLKMDVYEPVGDTLQERPLVLVFHDGNFLPPVYNDRIIGTKSDSSIVEICTQLALRGFTAAAVAYRLGWNPFGPSQETLAIGLIQAIYRGVQDGRTAIRFFRKDHAEENNQYHIDPNRIIVWGNGTGGVISLNMAALSHINDFSMTTNSPAKFIFDANGDGTPETPMVLEEFHGDIEGKTLTIAPSDFLGFEAGDTTNYENHPNYSSDFHLCVNVGGAVADISWLNDNTTPTLSFQSVFDPHYPYDDHLLVLHPGTPIFAMQGSKQVADTQEDLGHNQAWKDGIVQNEVFTQQAISNSNSAGHPYYDGLYPIVTPVNSNGFYEGVVIDWWDPNAPSPVDGPGMGLAWNELPYPGAPGLSFHEVGLLMNENMSAEKAKANIDTILNYFAPRACITLDLSACQGDIFTTSSEEAFPNSSILLFPNPTNGLLSIDAGHQIMQAIELYDLNGKLMRSYSLFSANQKVLDLTDLSKGFYVLKIRTERAYIFKKIIIN